MLSFSTLKACTQWFPFKLASFGWSVILAGRTSQKGLGRSRKIDLFPSPHHQTIPPLPLTSSSWPHHILYWLGTGWWYLGLARASLSDVSKSLPTAHAFAVIWRLFVCVFWPFMWTFLWFPALFKSWVLSNDGSYISLVHFWFSLFPATLNYYSCRDNLILLDLFWVNRLFLFSVACHRHCFAFTYGLLCPFGLSFGHPRLDCFLWAPLTRLLILHSHGFFTNFIEFPRPNNLILILGVHGLAINPLLS